MQKQPCQVGWIPAPRGWEGKTRHRAGVRASGTAALLTAACLQHPKGRWMGCFLGSARAELLPKVAEMGFQELSSSCLAAPNPAASAHPGVLDRSRRLEGVPDTSKLHPGLRWNTLDQWRGPLTRLYLGHYGWQALATPCRSPEQRAL